MRSSLPNRISTSEIHRNQGYSSLARRNRRLSLAGSSRSELGALLAGRLLNSLKLLAGVLDARSTSSANAGGVAIVGVDSNQGIDTLGLDVLDNNLAGALALVVGAVSARAVQLACIHDSESINGDSSLAVVLDHLILGLLSTSALDESISSSEDGNGILQATYQY